MKECFGTIYPDMTDYQFGKEAAGKVFFVKVDTKSGGQRDRELRVSLAEWEKCQSCESFRSCYDFSNAKLAMQQVAASI